MDLPFAVRDFIEHLTWGHSEPGQEVVVVIDIVSLKDKNEEFLKIAGEHVAKSRDADGVLRVAVLSSMCKPHSYKVVERYTSEAAWKNQSKAALSAAALKSFVYSFVSRVYQRHHIESNECNEGNGNEGNEIEAHPMSLF